jgi:hypothetical protein
VGEQLEGDRADQDRHLDLGAEDSCPGGHLRDVDQDAGPELPALVRLDVPPEGALVPGAAGEVAVRSGIELLEGQVLEIRDVDGAGDAQRLFTDRRTG